MATPTNPAPKHDVFSLYARLLVQEHLPEEENVNPLAAAAAAQGEAASSQEFTLQFVPIKVVDKEKPQVCILGAGAGGLYAAMMLKSLGIPFEILEAQDRTGGRLYTHHFIAKDKNGHPLPKQPKYDYYDVGAMRFPKTNIMTRLFHLFDLLKLTEENGKLIPYVFACNEAFKLYNGIRKTIGEVKTHSTEPDKVDPFRFARDHGGDVSNDFIYPGYSSLYSDAITPFSDALANDLKPGAQPANAGWRKLMRFDEYSTRGYMSECMKYGRNAINWMETMSYSTGWYDQSLAETVLEDMCFGGDPTKVHWVCLNGGSQKLSDAMEEEVQERPTKEKPLVRQVIKFGHLVSAIEAVPGLPWKWLPPKELPTGKLPEGILPEGKRPERELPVKAMRISFTTCEKDGTLKTEKKEYDHVISTIPLPTLRTLDIDNAGLSFKQRNALRLLQYGPSIKVGVKFTKAWWNGIEIKGGQSYSDRCIRTVVYPSYPKAEDSSPVLIASYCWTHDAVRMGALINAGKEADMRLKDLVLRDLANIHNLKYDDLNGMYIEHFAFDWTHDPLTQGKCWSLSL
ncbi:hypothetical protein FRB97_001345 [Tulasnella sp. 331]|nr:hypothetical protein FRB97_001345 [Tulasnella sp. 331]